MKITIDYNNDEIRIEEAGPVATFKITGSLKSYQSLLEEIFNRISNRFDSNLSLDITLVTEDEYKRKVIGEW